MPNEGQTYSHSGHSRDVNASQNIRKVIRYENNTHLILAWALALLLCSPFMAAHVQDANRISAQEARQIAEEACIYGYSLITMEMTRRVMTNVRELEGTRAPMGHLIRVREYPTACFRDVTAPNADTPAFMTFNELRRMSFLGRRYPLL